MPLEITRMAILASDTNRHFAAFPAGASAESASISPQKRRLNGKMANKKSGEQLSTAFDSALKTSA
ncbi:MAG: hypothetical protein GC179_06965 [Anaerolineaceae bacterium]|nr:hypothetical protein [Anaerolineaceae bacterium]